MTTPLPEPPVGPQYGLQPLRPELHERVIVQPDSTSLVSTEDYRTGTEFGGVGGLIQPPPHVPSAVERLSMIYVIDPADDGTYATSVQPPVLEGDFE